MRHLKSTAKLGRKSEHRNMMLANLVCSLIYHNRVVTTLAKAKVARQLAEKMVTLAKKGTLHARRLAVARLHQKDAVKRLFSEIAPAQKARNGGYTRIVKLHQRRGDASEMAVLEWVEPVESVVTAPASQPAEQKSSDARVEGQAQVDTAPKAEAGQEQAKSAESPEKK
ncbi:MAG: 50S ribosomal protein L17 [Verrucomicrobiae bacterium]|nr:50S ribosomal protein L17 [Verrucomicrobiae bacterium]